MSRNPKQFFLTHFLGKFKRVEVSKQAKQIKRDKRKPTWFLGKEARSWLSDLLEFLKTFLPEREGGDAVGFTFLAFSKSLWWEFQRSS